MILFCQKRKTDNSYHHFFKHKMAVSLCCNEEDIVQVEIVETLEEDNTHWGFKTFEDNSINFIFPTLLQVQICDPHFFKYDIEKNKGDFVKLKIVEL